MNTNFALADATPQETPTPSAADLRLARGPLAIVGTLIAGSIGLAAGMAIALLIVTALFSGR